MVPTGFELAITQGTTILTSGWTFISTNPILFGICAMSVVTGAIYSVKGLFR